MEQLRALPDVIEPKWWTGTPALPAERYTIDCSAYAMDDADRMRPASSLPAARSASSMA